MFPPGFQRPPSAYQTLRFADKTLAQGDSTSAADCFLSERFSASEESDSHEEASLSERRMQPFLAGRPYFVRRILRAICSPAYSSRTIYMPEASFTPLNST